MVRHRPEKPLLLAKSPSNRGRTSDLGIAQCFLYSPTLFQLSYRRAHSFDPRTSELGNTYFEVRERHLESPLWPVRITRVMTESQWSLSQPSGILFQVSFELGGLWTCKVEVLALGTPALWLIVISDPRHLPARLFPLLPSIPNSV